MTSWWRSADTADVAETAAAVPPAPLGVRASVLRWLRRLDRLTLWGHGARSLALNPVFALLPSAYIYTAQWTTGATSVFALGAFCLGFPHAGYTAFEVRHYFARSDGVADDRSAAQALFFGAHAVVGGALAIWYVAVGARVLSERFRLDPMPVTVALSVLGSVGAVMGLQDVVVADIIARPRLVLTAAVRAFREPTWARVTVPSALAQLVGALLLG